jgi:hypothetical protein
MDRLREYARQYVENNREKVRGHAMRYYWRHRHEIIVARKEEYHRKKLERLNAASNDGV